MNFGQALEFLKAGKKVARSGWNGKGMFLYYVQGTEVPPSNLRGAAWDHVGVDKSRMEMVKINGHIDMKTADGSITVGWAPSQVDMLAEDWDIVPNN